MEADTANGQPLVLVVAARQEPPHPFTALLEAKGYAVLHSYTGVQALHRVHHTSPDLIVVDAALRDFGALDLCRAMRDDPRHGSITPLVVTSTAPLARSQRLAALRSGAWECVGPGTDPEELLVRIRMYVRAKREADRLRVEGLVDSVTGLYNAQGLARRAQELGAEMFRTPGPLSCVVLAVEAEPGAPPERAERTAVRLAAALRQRGRRSDAIGRLSPTEFAVLAPGTDADGAVKLARRFASLATESSAPTAEAPLAVRAGSEAVANIKYTPIRPVDLVVHASAALRTGRPESGAAWIRRFESRAGS